MFRFTRFKTQATNRFTRFSTQAINTMSSSKKVVLVTGANKSIGYETVKALLRSEKPYHVILGSRSLERGQQAVATLQKECAESSSTVEALQLDISSDSSIEKAYEAVKASPGRLDCLINNAGRSYHFDP